MNSRLAMDCGIVGLLFLATGVLASFRQSTMFPPLQRWCEMGVPFVAGSLAAFGMQHILGATLLVEIVPTWMPARLFWVYFVGVALLAAAASFAARKAMRASAPMLAVLFLVLALLTDLPGVIATPRQWIGWSMVLRELSYAAGAAVASLVCIDADSPFARMVFSGARLIITVAIFYFALEQFLFPQYAPGVPDLIPTPMWVPVPRLITSLSGFVLLVSGALLLFRRYLALGAVLGGAWMTFLTLSIYVPTMEMKFGTAKAIEGVDFVFDTLLFGATLLLVGRHNLLLWNGAYGKMIPASGGGVSAKAGT